MLLKCLDGVEKKKKTLFHELKQTTSCVKHGGVSVMAWACVASTASATVVFVEPNGCIQEHSASCFKIKSKPHWMRHVPLGTICHSFFIININQIKAEAWHITHWTVHTTFMKLEAVIT